MSPTVGGKPVMQHTLVGVTTLATPIISIGDAAVVEGDGGTNHRAVPRTADIARRYR